MQLANGTATSAMSLSTYKLMLQCMASRAQDTNGAALFPAPVQLKVCQGVRLTHIPLPSLHGCHRGTSSALFSNVVHM